MSHGGRAAFELPAENELWKDPEWMKFEADHSMKRVFFNGCSFNLRGKGGELIKKPWAVSTSDMRLIQILDQHKCSGDHQYEPAMGGNAAHTAYYTPEISRNGYTGIPPFRERFMINPTYSIFMIAGCTSTIFVAGYQNIYICG